MLIPVVVTKDLNGNLEHNRKLHNKAKKIALNQRKGHKPAESKKVVRSKPHLIVNI